MTSKLRKPKTSMIKTTKQKDGRYFAQYCDTSEKILNGIGQFGCNPFEAEINLTALLFNVRRKMNKVIVEVKL